MENLAYSTLPQVGKLHLDQKFFSQVLSALESESESTNVAGFSHCSSFQLYPVS